MLEIFMWLLITIVIGTVTAIIGRKYGLGYILSMFSGAIVIAAVVAPKIIEIGPFTTNAGLVVYSITFLLTDTISEFWGKKQAKKAVWGGFLALIMLVFVTQISIHLVPASFWEGQEAFKQVLGSTWRISLASFIAYVIAQNHDVWAYHTLKRITKGKYLWLRNNISTWISQTIDTIIFITIAFYGLFPIGSLVLGTIFIKIIVAIIDTPFLYIIRWFCRRITPV